MGMIMHDDVPYGAGTSYTQGTGIAINNNIIAVDADNAPTENSEKPVKSKGVHSALEQIYADNGVLGAKNLFEFGNQNPTTFVKLKFSTPLPAGKYILSSKITTTFSGNIAQARFRKENESNLLVVSLIANTSKVESVQFQIEEPAYYVFLYASDGNTEYTCSWENIMLRLASDPDDTYALYAMTNRELTEAIEAIPTVNNGQLTIQQNGTSKATFTANQNGNATANIVTDDWVATGTVSSGAVSFSGIDDSGNYGYKPFAEVTASSTNKNPTAQISTLSGTGTSSMSVTYTTDADNGTTVKLRRIK